MDNMLEKLEHFLKKFPKKDNEKTSHSIIHPKEDMGSWTIPIENLDEFYKYVHRSIFVKGEKLSILERIQPICPFVIDLDFKYKEVMESRQYNKNVLKKIIENIFSILNDFYLLKEDQHVCWIMEKETVLKAPQKGYETKDGIHFLFPYIIAEKKSYLKIREELIKIDIHQIIKDENLIPPSNSIGEIVDESIYKSGNWFLYGSGKGNEIRYELTEILKYHNSSMINLPVDIYKNEPLEIIKLNSVGRHTKINVEYTENLQNKLKNKPNNSTNTSLTITDEIDDDEIDSKIHKKLRKKEREIAKNLVNLLLPKRAVNRQDWLNVGICLQNSSKSKESLKIWIDFSKKWDGYVDDTECKKKWKEFRTYKNDLTIRSLHYWAKEDNLDGYINVLMDSLEDVVKISIRGDKATGPHSDVANVIYNYYKHEFICANIRDNSWYYFNSEIGGKWEETEQGHLLRKKFSNDIVQLYMYFQMKYQDEINKCIDPEGDDCEKHTMYTNRVVNISKVIIKLKDSGYKDKIIKECKEYFYDKKFEDKLDSKKNLVGFENGVYDLNKSVFRDGLPDDYVTMSTGLTIPVRSKPCTIQDILEQSKDIENYHEINDGLDDFMKKVYPKVDVLEYTLRFLSSCLSGEIQEEKFYFWTGSGGNGKSKLVELIDHSLGEYSGSLDVAFLTSKRGCSSSASPELENVKNCRFVSMSEPEKEDVVYSGKLKQMSGGDKMTSRGLFKDTKRFKPQFKIILMCNDLPKLAGNDGGIWRRIEVVNYIAKFSDNPRPCEADPYQYLADEKLSSKLEEWKLLFMIKLLEKYTIYCVEGTNPPKEVKNSTMKYRSSNDIIANWIDDCVIEDDGFFTLDELFSAWERWCDEEGVHPKQRPVKKEIKNYLIKLQEKSKYGYVIGKVKDECANGTRMKPTFNLKPIDD